MTWLKMCKSQEMFKNKITTPPKVNNFTIMNSNDSEVNEVSDKEFNRRLLRMINKIKENRNKRLNEFQESTKKQLNE
jgi:hypothetical protein